MKKFVSILFITLGFCAISKVHSVEPSSQAIEYSQNMIIVDGHIDVPYRVHEEWVDVTQSTEAGDFDLPRAKSGGLNAPFMSIYVPAKLDDSAESTAHAHRMIDYVEAMVGRNPTHFAIATSPSDVESQFTQGLISLPLGMENGSPIQGDLSNLKTFYDRGIRYITLTHAKSNHISDSSYDDNKQWDGLSPFGEELIVEMNRLGVMVDISHVSDAAFYDAIKISKAPMIASHSSARKFTPGFERNMSDDMIIKLAEQGGVIMINFGSTFLTKQARDWSDKRSTKIKEMEKKHGKDSETVKDFSANYRDTHPLPFAKLSDVLDHIDHVVKIAGIDAVGLGSDYDGVGDSLPTDLKHVGDYPRLVQGLIDRGYDKLQIRKILGGNALRLWRKVESLASPKS